MIRPARGSTLQQPRYRTPKPLATRGYVVLDRLVATSSNCITKVAAARSANSNSAPGQSDDVYICKSMTLVTNTAAGGSMGDARSGSGAGKPPPR